MSVTMSSRDRLTLILLVAMSIFLFADQRIMSAILPELSQEYGIDERVLGFIGFAFTLVGVFVSIVFGFFSDRMSRKFMLILVSVPSANVKSIFMNVNRPEHRGSVFAVFNITDNLGQGFGPALGGLLVSSGYLFTMNFAASWWILCGLLFYFIAFSINRDRNTLQELLTDRAKKMRGNSS